MMTGKIGDKRGRGNNAGQSKGTGRNIIDRVDAEQLRLRFLQRYMNAFAISKAHEDIMMRVYSKVENIKHAQVLVLYTVNNWVFKTSLQEV